MAKCAVCGTALPASHRGRPARYCSAAHRSVAHRAAKVHGLALDVLHLLTTAPPDVAVAALVALGPARLDGCRRQISEGQMFPVSGNEIGDGCV